MDKTDKIALLNEAQQKIQEAIDMIADAVQDTDIESYASAYIIAHLENWALGHNPYDDSIPKLIKRIREE